MGGFGLILPPLYVGHKVYLCFVACYALGNFDMLEMNYYYYERSPTHKRTKM